MTNGKFLAKTNRRTINALILFLVGIVFFYSTSCNAINLGVQAFQIPKTPSKTILSTNNSPAIATTSFLKLPNDGPANFVQPPVPINNSSFKQLSVPHDGPVHFKQTFVPNENSSFKQLSVPHSGPAHFKQTFVPTTTTSTGLQAYNDHPSSLNDITAPQAFSAMTAITTATMTQVHAITTAITKATLLKLDKCFLHPTKTGAINSTIKSESLLFHARFGSAITTQPG